MKEMFEKVFGVSKGIFNIVTIIELVISIICVLLGLIYFSNNSMHITLVSVLTGILLIIYGVVSIYSFIKRDTIVLFKNNLIYGILLLVVGIISLFLGKYLTILLGIYFLICGAQKINYGYFFNKFKESSWLITLVIGILLIVIGIVSFFTSLDNVVTVVGITLFGFGTLNFINMLLLRRRSQYFIA